MGMYDSFFMKTKCPFCGYEGEFEFQTKELTNCLENYRVGDTVLFSTDYLEFAPEPKRVKIHNCLTDCPKCDEFFLGDVMIENNVFKGVLNVRKWR